MSVQSGLSGMHAWSEGHGAVLRPQGRESLCAVVLRVAMSATRMMLSKSFMVSCFEILAVSEKKCDSNVLARCFPFYNSYILMPRKFEASLGVEHSGTCLTPAQAWQLDSVTRASH